jgi:hypothetical protein
MNLALVVDFGHFSHFPGEERSFSIELTLAVTSHLLLCTHFHVQYYGPRKRLFDITNCCQLSVLFEHPQSEGNMMITGPRFLNFEKIGPFLKLEKDKLTIQYTGPGNQYQDVGVSS